MLRKIKYLLIIPIIFLFLYLFGIFLKKYKPSTICNLSGGKYLSDYRECQGSVEGGIDKLLCVLTGSKYDSCASPCRHSPGGECITICQQVCKF